jgi:hypothetical protein
MKKIFAVALCSIPLALATTVHGRDDRARDSSGSAADTSQESSPSVPPSGGASTRASSSGGTYGTPNSRGASAGGESAQAASTPSKSGSDSATAVNKENRGSSGKNHSGSSVDNIAGQPKTEGSHNHRKPGSSEKPGPTSTTSGNTDGGNHPPR